MLEAHTSKLKQRALICCVVVALAFCSAFAMGVFAGAPTSHEAYAASKLKAAKVVDAGNKNKVVTKKTINLALTGRNATTLKVVSTPAKGAVKSIKWYSTSKKVATVSSKGHVVAKKKGSATIKAKVKARKGKSRTVYVKVKVSTGGWQKSGKVTKASTCSKRGTKVVKSLDGWKTKTVALPLLAHKLDDNFKCTVCGKQGGGLAIAQTAVALATGAEGSKNGVRISADDGSFKKQSDFERAGGYTEYKDYKKYYKSSRPQADAFNKAFDSVNMNMKSWQYPDCGYSVIVAARYSGVDTTFCDKKGSKNVKEIKKYLNGSAAKAKGWKKIGTYYKGSKKGFASFQPGDILIHVRNSEAGTGGDHARLYVGYETVKANSKYADVDDDDLWFSDAAYGAKKYPFLNTEGKTSNEFSVYRLS